MSEPKSNSAASTAASAASSAASSRIVVPKPYLFNSIQITSAHNALQELSNLVSRIHDWTAFTDTNEKLKYLENILWQLNIILNISFKISPEHASALVDIEKAAKCLIQTYKLDTIEPIDGMKKYNEFIAHIKLRISRW